MNTTSHNTRTDGSTEGDGPNTPEDLRMSALVQMAIEAEAFERLVESQSQLQSQPAVLATVNGGLSSASRRSASAKWIRGFSAAAAVALCATAGVIAWKSTRPEPAPSPVVVFGVTVDPTGVRTATKPAVTEAEVEAAHQEMLALQRSVINEPRGKFTLANAVGTATNSAGDLAEGLAMMLAVFRESTTGAECVNLRSLGSGQTLADLSGEELIDVAFAEPCMENADSVVVYAMAGDGKALPANAQDAATIASCLKSQGGIDAQACGGDEECHIERAGLCLPANVVTRAAGR